MKPSATHSLFAIVDYLCYTAAEARPVERCNRAKKKKKHRPETAILFPDAHHKPFLFLFGSGPRPSGFLTQAFVENLSLPTQKPSKQLPKSPNPPTHCAALLPAYSPICLFRSRSRLQSTRQIIAPLGAGYPRC